MHQVEVDVDQAVGAPRGRPRSCRTASWASVSSSSGRRRRPRRKRASASGRGSRSGAAGRRRRSRRRRSSRSCADAAADERARGPRRRRRSRGCRARASAGRRGRRWRAPGRERVQRHLGALAGQRRREDLVAVAARGAPPRGARRARTTLTPSASSRRSSCDSVSSRPRGDPRRRPRASGSSRRARPGTASAPRRRCAPPGRAATGPSPRAARGRGSRSDGLCADGDGHRARVRYHVRLYASRLALLPGRPDRAPR